MPETSHPWRWLETIITADGYRTRVVDGVYRTQEEALAAMDAKTKTEESE